MKNNRRKENNFEVRLNSLNHKINRKAMILSDAVNQSEILRNGDKMRRFYLETVYTPVGSAVSRYPEGAEISEAVEKICYIF